MRHVDADQRRPTERWPQVSAPDVATIRPAGSPAEVFIPHLIPDLIPVADAAAGTSLCVNARTGELHGCVVEYSASVTTLAETPE